MLFPLLNILLQTYGPAVFGIAAAVLYKTYFNSYTRRKIKGYQDDILKSDAKIVELQAWNKDLSKRLKEMETYFSKDHISMN